jgi:hypothetical protein
MANHTQADHEDDLKSQTPRPTAPVWCRIRAGLHPLGRTVFCMTGNQALWQNRPLLVDYMAWFLLGHVFTPFYAHVYGENYGGC